MRLNIIIITSILLQTTQSIFGQVNLDSLDLFINANVEKYEIPGAVVSIVYQDSILYMKGFGMEDVKEKTPIAPSNTVFRVASLSKLLTTVAVLQLVESGAISLSDDISPYLTELDKNKRFEEPITLRHLLTHTSGFDNSDIADATWDTKDLLSCSDFLKSHSLYQAYPPGQVWRYSNYNMVLVGYIIEQLSGKEYTDYMKTNLLDKIKMTNSTFQQGLINTPSSHLAKTYKRNADNNTITKQDYSLVIPAGGLSTTGQDMSHFMIALLNDGFFEDNQLLSAESISEMFKQQWSYPGQILGHALGFREDFFGETRNDYGTRRSLYHTGARPGFSSEMVILPEYKLGVFISASSRSRSFTYAITNYILSNYSGAKLKFENQTDSYSSDIFGTYRSVAFPRGTCEKFGGFLAKRFYKKVAPSAVAGNIIIGDREYGNIGNGQFIDADSTVIFSLFESNGKLLLTSGLNGFEKIPWYFSRSFQKMIFFTFIALFLSAIIIWPFARRRLINEYKRMSMKLGITLCIVGLLTIIGLMIATEIPEHGTLFDHGIPLGLTLVFSFPLVVFALLIPYLFYIYKEMRITAPWWFRTQQFILIMASCMYLFWTYYWNLNILS